MAGAAAFFRPRASEDQRGRSGRGARGGGRAPTARGTARTVRHGSVLSAPLRPSTSRMSRAAPELTGRAGALHARGDGRPPTLQLPQILVLMCRPIWGPWRKVILAWAAPAAPGVERAGLDIWKPPGSVRLQHEHDGPNISVPSRHEPSRDRPLL